MADKNVNGDILVVGAKAHPLRDIYHRFLTARWPTAIGAIVVAYLAINVLYAAFYMLAGGIEGTASGQAVTYAEAFFFSAQTLGTIGYGAMHPTGTVANLLVVSESIVSVLFCAIATGIMFARFTRSSETIIFSNRPCVALMDGVPTLVMRVGNDRESAVVDAQVRITYTWTHRTAEGVLMYRMKDIDLARDRTPSLGRTWTVLHPINESSPLYKKTPEDCEREEVELIVAISGTDSTSLQPVHAGHRYLAKDLLWGSRLGDVLRELKDGRLELDCRKFHDTVKCQASEDFFAKAEKARG
jgi:inward rectifier potassium channel